MGHQKLPKFEAAFDAPFINWTRPLDPKEYTEHLYAAHKVLRLSVCVSLARSTIHPIHPIHPLSRSQTTTHPPHPTHRNYRARGSSPTAWTARSTPRATW